MHGGASQNHSPRDFSDVGALLAALAASDATASKGHSVRLLALTGWTWPEAFNRATLVLGLCGAFGLMWVFHG